MVGNSAADHHQISPVGQPFVAERRKFDQVGSQRFERFQRVGKITAEGVVMGVGDLDRPPAVLAMGQARSIVDFGKRATPCQFVDGRQVGMLSERARQFFDQLVGQPAAARQCAQAPRSLRAGSRSRRSRAAWPSGGTGACSRGSGGRVDQSIEQHGVDCVGQPRQDGRSRPRSLDTTPPRRSASRGSRRSVSVLPGNRNGVRSIRAGLVERALDQGQLGRSGRTSEQRPADRRGHQPGVEMPPRQARHLTDRLGRRRARPGAEMLDTPPPFGQPGQHRHSRQRRLRSCRPGRQRQSRKFHHGHYRDETSQFHGPIRSWFSTSGRQRPASLPLWTLLYRFEATSSSVSLAADAPPAHPLVIATDERACTHQRNDIVTMRLEARRPGRI